MFSGSLLAQHWTVGWIEKDFIPASGYEVEECQVDVIQGATQLRAYACPGDGCPRYVYPVADFFFYFFKSRVGQFRYELPDGPCYPRIRVLTDETRATAEVQQT